MVGIRRPHLLNYHQICRRGLRHCRGLPDCSGSPELRGCGMHWQTEWTTVLTDMTTYVTESRYRPVGAGEDGGVCRSFEACMQPNKQLLRSKGLPLVMVGRARFCCTGGWEPFGAGRQLHNAQGQWRRLVVQWAAVWTCSSRHRVIGDASAVHEERRGGVPADGVAATDMCAADVNALACPSGGAGGMALHTGSSTARL